MKGPEEKVTSLVTGLDTVPGFSWETVVYTGQLVRMKDLPDNWIMGKKCNTNIC